MSGFIASPRHWAKFNREWTAALDNEGVPEFHSIDFFARKEKTESEGCYEGCYYGGWSDERAFNFLNSLLDAIQRDKRLHPIGGALHLPSYRKLIYGHQKMVTGGIVQTDKRGHHKWISSGSPGKPYFSPFLWLLLEAMQNAKDRSTIDFVFDQQEQMEGRAIVTFLDIKKMIIPDRRNQKLGMVSYASRLEYQGLQAADMHTNLWYSFLTRGANVSPEQRHALGRLAKSRSFMKVLDGPSLQLLIDTTPEHQRAFIEETQPPVKNKKSKKS